MHVCARACVCVCVCARTHTHTHTHTHTDARTHTHTCTCMYQSDPCPHRELSSFLSSRLFPFQRPSLERQRSVSSPTDQNPSLTSGLSIANRHLAPAAGSGGTTGSHGNTTEDQESGEPVSRSDSDVSNASSKLRYDKTNLSLFHQPSEVSIFFAFSLQEQNCIVLVLDSLAFFGFLSAFSHSACLSCSCPSLTSTIAIITLSG